jgi:hypothetical protein
MSESKGESIEERMYQRSIDVYEFQAKKNSTWMHLYALFTGAFFIAYYTVLPKNIDSSFLETFNECFSATSNAINNDISFFIAFLGLISSICWLGSYHAYHCWLKNYVKLIHMHESEIPEVKANSKLRVHSIGFEKDLVGKIRGFSGEKINRAFIFVVIVGWCYLLLINTQSYIQTFIYGNIITIAIIMKVIVSIIAAVLIIKILPCIFSGWLSSLLKSNGIEGMHIIKLENSVEHYKVYPPKEEIQVNKGGCNDLMPPLIKLK